ncbi:MAG: restriction endonuclease subunit S [Peptococcaceae bacterium]|nr:restriction endonuclease subunit S [Peptococcaceae bacterium]
MDASLNEKLHSVEWGEYRINDLFKILKVTKMLSKEDLFVGAEFPAYSAESKEGGIIGYTNEPEFICTEQNPIYVVFGDHTRTFNIALKSFSVLDNVKVLIPCVNSYKAILFLISVWKKQIPNLGYSRHWKVASQCILKLPTKKGQIDFDFMENFIAELEAQRIAELEAYLSVTGLKDTHLSPEEEQALKELDTIEWEEHRLGDLFEIRNTLSFNTDKLVYGSDYDYVTRTSLNQGILQTTGFVNRENINPSGTWSLGLLQMDFFYRRKPWYAGQFIRKINPKIEIKGTSILFFTTLLNKQKSKLLSVLVRDVDKVFCSIKIQLPTKHGKIDFDFMENFISAIQKIVIQDVVAYSDKKLAATKQVISK